MPFACPPILRRALLAALALAPAAACTQTPPPPPDDGALQIRGGAQPLAEWSFGAVLVGEASGPLGITVANAGGATTAPLAIAITGDGTDFTAEDPASDCAGVSLAPDALCSLRIRFRPTTTGAREATLTVSDGHGLSTTLTLRGTGLDSAVVLNPAAVDFGTVALGAAATRTVTVANAGATPIVVQTVLAAGGFEITADDCPGPLAAGAQCAVTLRFAPVALGDRAGSLVVETDVGSATAALHGVGAGQSLTILGAGGAAGEVQVDGAACALPCTVPVVNGQHVRLDAFTPSTFAGWTGACTAAGARPICELTVSGSPTTTARFEPDAGEAWSAALPLGVVAQRVAFAGDEVVVGARDRGNGGLVVTRFRAPGVVVWQSRFPSSTDGLVTGVAAAADGSAYVLDQGNGELRLRKLTATGEEAWLRTIAATWSFGADWPQTLLTDNLMMAPGGDVIVAGAGAHLVVRAYRPDGSIHWAQETRNGRPLDLAVAPDGRVLVQLLGNEESQNREVVQYAADGTDLGSDLMSAPAHFWYQYESIGFDSSGRFLSTISDASFNASGNVQPVRTYPGLPEEWLTRPDAAGIGADGQGAALVLSVALSTVSTYVQWELRKYTAAGPRAWTRLVRPYEDDAHGDYTWPRAFAGAGNGQSAIAGTWERRKNLWQPGIESGFVRVFAP